MGSNSGLCMSQPSPEIGNNANEPFPATASSRPVSPSVAAEPPPARAPCSKVLKGQFISGEHAVYDIDKQLSGDTLQHLEVLPISVYGWDLVLVTGRQVAVNRKYICYCLRPGSIRILSRNVASRGLFQGHSQRVTDMSFFAENVHLVASASLDGRLLVWKILEDHCADDKFQLSGHILLAIQFDGEWKDMHPRVCWHPHSQECLIMCINKYVLKIDLNEARIKAVKFTEETFLKCHIPDLIAGVQLIGVHDDLVTDLSICSRGILCIASASRDGTVRIWEGSKMNLLSVFIPHQGQPVGSIAFVSVPNRSDEAVLLTGGHLNHNLKLWVPANATGSLDSSIWCSVQTLELKSSAEVNVEQAFFNQVCVVPQAGVVLIGNTKKHAIYSIHLDFGSAALATRMDYLVEVSIAMPILSLTAMVDVVVNHKDIIQVFCVQTRAIQQYSFDVSLCIPTQEQETSVLSGPPLSGVLVPPKISVPKAVEVGKNNLETEVTDRSVEETKVKPTAGNLNLACEHNLVTDSGSGFGSWVEVPNWVAATLKKNLKTGSMKDGTDLKETTLTSSLSPLAPVLKSRTVSSSEGHVEGRSSSFLSSTDCKESSEKCRLSNVRPQFSPTLTLLPEEEDKCRVTEGPLIPMGAVTLSSETTSQLDSQSVSTRSCLIAPSKLMAMACFEAAAVVASKLSRNARQEGVSIDPEVETELDAGKNEIFVTKGTELFEQESNTGKLVSLFERENDRSSSPLKESEHQENNCLGVSNKCKKQAKEASVDISESPSGATTRSYNAKKKKSKNKTRDGDMKPQTVYGCMPMPRQVPVPVFENTSQVPEDNEDRILKSVTFPEIAFEDLGGQGLAMQETFVELLAYQEDMQRHVSMAIATSLSTETMQMESAFEQSLDNSFKTCMDSFWHAFDKETRESETLQEECFQQLTRTATNFMDKEAGLACNPVFKTEVTSIGSKIGQLASSNVDTAIATTMSQNFEGFHEKTIKQLEKTLSAMLDSSIPWQCHRHFTTSAKHLLQDDVCSCFQEQAFPKFESLCEDTTQKSCDVLYEEVSEYAVFEERRLGSMCLALSSAIEETLVSSSSAASSLKEELCNAEKRIQNRAEHASVKHDLVTLYNMPNSAEFQSKQSEMPYDFVARLGSWLKEGQFEDAFTHALSSGNVTCVFWLCKQVDPRSLFAAMPPPLSQGVLLSLVQQLGYDLGNDSSQKLTWIQEASLALNPNDHVMGSYMRPYLDQLYQNLQRHIFLFSTDPKLSNQARVVMHIVNSLLTTCK